MSRLLPAILLAFAMLFSPVSALSAGASAAHAPAPSWTTAQSLALGLPLTVSSAPPASSGAPAVSAPPSGAKPAPEPAPSNAANSSSSTTKPPASAASTSASAPPASTPAATNASSLDQPSAVTAADHDMIQCKDGWPGPCLFPDGTLKCTSRQYYSAQLGCVHICGDYNSGPCQCYDKVCAAGTQCHDFGTGNSSVAASSDSSLSAQGVAAVHSAAGFRCAAPPYLCSGQKSPSCSFGTCSAGYSCVANGQLCGCVKTDQLPASGTGGQSGSSSHSTGVMINRWLTRGT